MMAQHRLFWPYLLGLALTLAACRSSRDDLSRSSQSLPLARLRAAHQALIELEPASAQRLLEGLPASDPRVSLLRARAAFSLGDCETATILLSGSAASKGQDGELSRVAEGCAKAMAGAEASLDESRGVWVRAQNPRDSVLLPLIAEVAHRAASSTGERLGVKLPKPIRIELVSDLMSLSYLTGLPLEAAETTGTIAIARFGKVTMLSPRATREGFPWQDTLAHELTHLLVSKKSGDEAPLWLQEGIAKREEYRWREPMPLDDGSAAHEMARVALRDGKSVGITRLGASMALLPSPEMASIAYAEVQDFVDYVVSKTSNVTLQLLLWDLRGLGAGKIDQALSSVTGYSEAQWERRWQRALLDESVADVGGMSESRDNAMTDFGEGWQLMRLGALLAQRNHSVSAERVLLQMPAEFRADPQLRVALALSLAKQGRLADARAALGDATDLGHLDGSWFAAHGRFSELMGSTAMAAESFERSLAFAPTLERVACRGVTKGDLTPGSSTPALPVFEPWRSLCVDARSSLPFD